MTDLATVEPSALSPEQQTAILQHLGLNPKSVDTQALLLICDRYGLDPLLKHVVLISGRPYVTRDGYLAVAHRSGQLDGLEIVDQGEDETHWWAKVAVFRKDMTHPFTYLGRYPKADAKHMAKYGPEMAIKCGEVMALRRAFNVTGIGAADEQWDNHTVQLPPADPRLEEIMRRWTELPVEKNDALFAWIGKHIFNDEPGWAWEDIPEGWWDQLEGFLDKAEAPDADDHEPSRPVEETADPTLLDAVSSEVTYDDPDEEPF